MTTGIFALESIEGFDDSMALTQHLQDEAEADKTGDYDQLHEKTKELIASGKETDMSSVTSSSSDDSSSDSGGGDDFSFDMDEPTDEEPVEDAPVDDVASDDTSKDTPEDKSKEDHEKETPKDDASSEPSEPVEKDGKLQTPVTEMLRNDYYDRVVLEAIEMQDVKDVASSLGRGVMFAGRVALDLAMYLKELGIQYSPAIIAGLKKTVVYLFTRSVRLLLKTIVGISDYIKRHARSFGKAKKEIASLRESLAALEREAQGGTTALKKPATDDLNLISWFTAGNVTNPTHSADIIYVFMKDTIKQIDADISLNIRGVRKLIELSQTSIKGDPIDMLVVPPFSGRYLKRRVTQGADEPLTERYIYATGLPDQVVFVAELPKAGLTTIEEIADAYRDSGVFLTTDTESRPTAEKVDYMDITGITRFLDVLEGVCDVALEHQSFYDRINKQVGELKFGYRHYYQKLTETKEQSSIRESLVEYVYLKQSFASKIYLPAAMDIHDYTAAYLVRALRFAKENIKQLQVVKPESTV